MTITFTELLKMAAVFGADMSYYADLNFKTQTVPTRLRDINNRPQVASERRIIQ